MQKQQLYLIRKMKKHSNLIFQKNSRKGPLKKIIFIKNQYLIWFAFKKELEKEKSVVWNLRRLHLRNIMKTLFMYFWPKSCVFLLNAISSQTTFHRWNSPWLQILDPTGNKITCISFLTVTVTIFMTLKRFIDPLSMLRPSFLCFFR